MGLFSNSGRGTKIARSLSQDLRGKHFVVTGANAGLGYATTRELAKMGAKVTMACRSPERGQQAADRIRQEALARPVKEGVDLLEGLEDVDLTLEILDLGSLKSIETFARRMMEAGFKVDVLINNAGICGVPERRETADGLEMQIGVNHFGTHLLTRLMEPMISDGGRVVFLSSLGHDKAPAMPKTTWDWDNINYERPESYHSMQAYGRSKLANVLDTKEFAKRLAGRGINTYAVHPGLVKTEIHRSMTKNRVSAAVAGAGYAVIGWLFLQQPLEGCSMTLMCALDPALAGPEFSGKYWGGMKEERPSELASDPANPPRLWSYTEGVLEAKLGMKVDDVMMSWR